MVQDVWRLGAAKLVMIHDGRIAQLTFSGLLTTETLGGLIRQASDLYGARTRGWVSDFTGAALVAPVADLAHITLSTQAGHVLRKPGAFVVGVGSRDAMREHARIVSAGGVRRRTFLDRATAVEWVSTAALGQY